jgi:hypothetical protein
MIDASSRLSARLAGTLLFLAATSAGAQTPTSSPETRESFSHMSSEAERTGLTEPFRGITADGAITPGLFPIRSTGVSTAPVRSAAEGFLATLTAEQRGRTTFPVDDPEWRKWMNRHFYVRQGVGFAEMSDPQREAAIRLMRESLSARGLELSRTVMKLNEPLAELTRNPSEYGEDRYSLTLIGPRPPTSRGDGSSTATTSSSTTSFSATRWS